MSAYSQEPTLIYLFGPQQTGKTFFLQALIRIAESPDRFGSKRQWSLKVKFIDQADMELKKIIVSNDDIFVDYKTLLKQANDLPKTSERANLIAFEIHGTNSRREKLVYPFLVFDIKGKSVIPGNKEYAKNYEKFALPRVHEICGQVAQEVFSQQQLSEKSRAILFINEETVMPPDITIEENPALCVTQLIRYLWPEDPNNSTTATDFITYWTSSELNIEVPNGNELSAILTKMNSSDENRALAYSRFTTSRQRDFVNGFFTAHNAKLTAKGESSADVSIMFGSPPGQLKDGRRNWHPRSNTLKDWYAWQPLFVFEALLELVVGRNLVQ